MKDSAGLPDEIRSYLGTTRRTWELDDPYARLSYAKLYAEEEVPRIGFKVERETLVPIRNAEELRESPGSMLIGYDLIAELGSVSLPSERLCEENTVCFGALMWFPALGEFGSWCAYKRSVLLYPAIEFSDVLSSPIDYIYARGLPKNRVTPYTFSPWVEQFPDDDRCQALIVRARDLQREATRLPDALKAALMATDRHRVVAEQSRQLADYLANQLIRAVRAYDGVVTICDKLLQSLTLEPQFACALINEAARFECNSGNDSAAIARLKCAINEPAYAEYRDRFSKIIDHIVNLPPT